MISVKHLTKCYGEFTAVDDLSFEIDEGHVYGFLGPNGAGKTTLINCILKMIKPDSGIIELDGKNIFDYKNRAYFSQVGALLETSSNIYDYLTGMQNIEYFAGLMNLDTSSLKKADRYIDEFKLRSAIHNPAGDYSRGMQQKLALIIALMASPKLLLLDEPTLGLDIESKLSVIDILNNVVKEEQMSVILTTHQMEVVQKLNSRILILKNGMVSGFDLADFEQEEKDIDEVILEVLNETD